MNAAARRPLWLLACFALFGCPDKSGGVVLVKNVCATDLDCVELDAGPDAQAAFCNESTLQCERDVVESEYPLVLQVRPNSPGLGLVEQCTYRARTLTGSPDDYTLEVPAAVPISGTVSWIDEGSEVLLESEVTFVPLPEDEGAPVTSEVVTTPGGPGASAPNLQTNLIPEICGYASSKEVVQIAAQLAPLSAEVIGQRCRQLGTDAGPAEVWLAVQALAAFYQRAAERGDAVLFRVT